MAQNREEYVTRFARQAIKQYKNQEPPLLELDEIIWEDAQGRVGAGNPFYTDAEELATRTIERAAELRDAE